MNVKELIEKIEALPAENYKYRPYIDKKVVLALVRQLDEPQKVVVPQYIADKIEYCKESDDYSLFHAIDYCYNFKKCASWLMFKGNIETFALAWIFGYEVERELKYIVKFKGFNPRYIILKYQPYDKTWFLGGKQEYEFYRTHHTRKQLEEAGFGWVFDCEGIEVEEVTE